MNLIDKIFNAGIVGCGGAGFPTHVKLNAKVEHFIINAAECEPLLRTDRYLMKTEANKIIEAAEAVQKQLSAADCTIALKAGYHEEIAALEKAISARGSSVRLHKMDSFYPAGDEQVIVCEVTGRVVPPAGIPLDVGCVVSNLATVYCIYNAMNDRPFIKKYLTVTGEVNNPTVLCVPIGTSFAECLELAGGTPLSDYFVVSGGPMMGKPLTREQALDSVVTKTTSGFLILPPDCVQNIKNSTAIEHMLNRAKSACIQCKFCTDLCPRHMLGHPLEPNKIMRKVAGGTPIADMLDDPVIRNAQYCCECGACELYACPMQLQPRRINVLIKQEYAKQGIRPQKGEGEYTPNLNREYRKLPTPKVASRAGVGKYYHININSFKEYTPGKVTIPLRQHIGVPAEPKVNVGDTVELGQLIAACPEGKLGTNYHASIAGKVTAVGDKITIES
ncbi:MAG: SLBB domain-containing protein [Clostridiales bacterium]|nr:SLBB domain-containing protein [Clostridiales bacterium]